MKKDLNEIARYEVAISKKYGKEAIKHPKADWSDEKGREDRWKTGWRPTPAGDKK